MAVIAPTPCPYAHTPQACFFPAAFSHGSLFFLVAGAGRIPDQALVRGARIGMPRMLAGSSVKKHLPKCRRQLLHSTRVGRMTLTQGMVDNKGSLQVVFHKSRSIALSYYEAAHLAPGESCSYEVLRLDCAPLILVSPVPGLIPRFFLSHYGLCCATPHLARKITHCQSCG